MGSLPRLCPPIKVPTTLPFGIWSNKSLEDSDCTVQTFLVVWFLKVEENIYIQIGILKHHRLNLHSESKFRIWIYDKAIYFSSDAHAYIFFFFIFVKDHWIILCFTFSSDSVLSMWHIQPQIFNFFHHFYWCHARVFWHNFMPFWVGKSCKRSFSLCLFKNILFWHLLKWMSEFVLVKFWCIVPFFLSKCLEFFFIILGPRKGNLLRNIDKKNIRREGVLICLSTYVFSSVTHFL